VTGRIFNIQRFSLHDGPGIRTTVFLKGCTLRCRWCHNPESLSAEKELVFVAEKCIGCGACFEACPTGALSLVEGQRRYDAVKCRLCGKCAEACFAGALELEGRDVTVEEVVEEVLRDRIFYETSGGGVTLSGGEPLMQADFAAEVLARCRAEALHTAVDTAANVPWDAFERTLPHTSLVLLDLKLLDEERHRVATGAGNALILENARRLGAGEVPVVVRVPVIPGQTDDAQNLAAIAEFVGEMERVEEVELLPYHRFAEAKYRRLRLGYALEGTEPPSAERLAELAGHFASRGIPVRYRGQTARASSA